MKKISLVVVASMLLVSGNLFANDPIPNDPTQSLNSQIANILEHNNFALDKDITAKVEFTVNQDQEIVILDVETKHAILKRFLKNRLNHRKIKLEGVEEGAKYVVPVRLIAS